MNLKTLLMLKASSGGGTQEIVIIPEQTVTASSNYTELTYLEPLVNGEAYKITINGETLTSTAGTQYGGLYVWFGTPAYTTPAIEYVASNNKMYLNTLDSSIYGTYTVKVVKGENSVD